MSPDMCLTASVAIVLSCNLQSLTLFWTLAMDAGNTYVRGHDQVRYVCDTSWSWDCVIELGCFAGHLGPVRPWQPNG